MPAPPADPTSRHHVRRLLEQQILQLWGKGRTELIGANYDPAVIDHMPIPGQPTGLDGMAQVVRDFRAGLPDLTMTLHGTIVTGDHGCDFWTLTATHAGPLFGRAATRRRIEISGIDMIRVRGGRIGELWHVEQMLRMDEQLGAAPAAPAVSVPSSDLAPEAPPRRARWLPDPATLTARERLNLAIARDHAESMRTRPREDDARRRYAPDVVDLTAAPGQRRGIAGLLDQQALLHGAAPRLRRSIDACLVEGDLAAYRWTATGVHDGAPLFGLAARGRPFRLHGMEVIHIRDDGLIDRVFHVEEWAQLRAQIA